MPTSKEQDDQDAPRRSARSSSKIARSRIAQAAGRFNVGRGKGTSKGSGRGSATSAIKKNISTITAKNIKASLPKPKTSLSLQTKPKFQK